MYYELENIILGNIIVDTKLYHQNAQLFNIHMFDDPSNILIYKAFTKIIKKGKEPDIVNIGKELGTKSKLSVKVVQLTSTSTLMPREFDSALQSLVESSKRKIVNEYLQEINNHVQNQSDIAVISDKINDLQNRLVDNHEDKDKTLIKQLVEFTEDLAVKINTEGITGITTGFKSLDDFTNGWQPTDLIIVGGASSMGKTSFAVTTAFNAARAKNPIAIFSYEMSSIQLLQRMVSIQSGVSSHWLRKGALDEQEIKKVNKAVGYIENLPLIIDDCNNTDLSYLLSKIKQYVHTNKIKLVLVDYLQLVTCKRSSREQEVSAVARALKNLAKELDIAIIALSQLNRGVSFRADSKPTMSDLRESGEIEQAADIVALIYRPEYYGLHEDETGNPTKGLAKVIFAKGRNIGVGEINLRFVAEQTKFEDYENI